MSTTKIVSLQKLTKIFPVTFLAMENTTKIAFKILQGIAVTQLPLGGLIIQPFPIVYVYQKL